MRRILLLIASLLLAAGPALAVAGPAGAATGDVTCPNGFLGQLQVAHDLTVPANSSCGLTEGSTIGHNVYVYPGASFDIGGTTIGNDLISYKAGLIRLGDVNNGTSDTVIGNDALIIGTVAGGDFICQTRIGHDLVVAGTASTASGWYIGAESPPHAQDGCSGLYGPRFGDTIGYDGIFYGNAGSHLDVASNQPALNGGTGPGFGHDLLFYNNDAGFNDLTGNTVGHDCSQNGNHPYLGSGNTAGKNVDECNSANS